MKELTLKQIADWCGGTVAPEYETVPVTGVESDSRKVEVGDLFVALHGGGRQRLRRGIMYFRERRYAFPEGNA